MAGAAKYVLGLRPHTGWAAAIVLSGTAAKPVVVARQRLALVEPDGKYSRFLYHEASELEPRAATRWVTDGRRKFAASTLGSLRAFCEDLSKGGKRIGAAALLRGNRPFVATLDQILAAHPKVHSAEGELYRDLLAEACASLGIPAVPLGEKAVWAQAARVLKLSEEQLRARLQALGQEVGSPWGEDQRLAAAAGWAVLAGLRASRSSAAARSATTTGL
jgi:hypothetical protein